MTTRDLPRLFARSYAWVFAILVFGYLVVYQTSCGRANIALMREVDRFIEECVNSNRPCPGVAPPELLAQLRAHGLPVGPTGKYGQISVGGTTVELSANVQAPDRRQLNLTTLATQTGETFRITRLIKVKTW